MPDYITILDNVMINLIYQILFVVFVGIVFGGTVIAIRRIRLWLAKRAKRKFIKSARHYNTSMMREQHNNPTVGKN